MGKKQLKRLKKMTKITWNIQKTGYNL